MGNLQVIMETQPSEMIQRSRPNTVEGSTRLFICFYFYFIFFGAAGLRAQREGGSGCPRAAGPWVALRGGARSRSIPPRCLPRSCSVFLSDDAHFVLTITREDVQQKLLKLDAWKSGLGDCHRGAGSGEQGGVSKRSPLRAGTKVEGRGDLKK